MKEIYREEEGVSPVIATILMVAITVVLAATVYIMVGSMDIGETISVVGSLSYLSSSSNTTKAVFQITLSQPSNPEESVMKITVLKSDGIDGSADISSTAISHIVSDDTHIKSGDRIIVTAVGDTDISGYELVISFSGYDGIVSKTIPI